MYKYIYFATISFLFHGGVLLAESSLPSLEKTLRVQELTEEMLQEIFCEKNRSTTLEFTKGDLLPFHYFLDGDLVKLSEKGALQVEQTFYVRVEEEDLLFSLDKVRWKPLLEFVTGNTSAMLSIENNAPLLTLGAFATKREEL